MITVDNNIKKVPHTNDKRDKPSTDNEETKKRADVKRMPVIPPPYPLLPKSKLPSEPVRTGSSIPFLKLTYVKGGSNLLFEKQ